MAAIHTGMLAINCQYVGHSKAVEPRFVEVDGQRITYELIYQDVSNLLKVTRGGKEAFVFKAEFFVFLQV